MKRVPVQGVQPSLLKWARESLELSVAQVAELFNGASSRVEEWENGTDAPTYAELERLAYDVYKRPLAVFFLPAPPSEPRVKREFRTLPQVDLDQLKPDTIVHIRKARSFQLGIRTIFPGGNPAARMIWTEAPLSQDQPVISQAKKVRQTLGVGLEEQSQWRSDDKALKAWRTRLEALGIFVFKAAFHQKEISGFCLPDSAFPVIYLNNSTTKTRQIFSLFHELAHVLLQVRGLSRFDAEYIERLPDDMARVERFCNALAAEVLIPSDDFSSQTQGWPARVNDIDDGPLERLALRYGVSREAVLRRFLDQGRVDPVVYQQRSQFWAAQVKKSTGGDYYASQNTYLSLRYAQEVVSMHYRNQITQEEAADYLGIAPKNFEGLEHRILQGAVS